MDRTTQLHRQLHEALREKNVALVNYLVSEGADVNIVNAHNGMVPIVLAADYLDTRMCLTLMHHGASLQGDGVTKSPLGIAVSAKLERAVKMLIALGANPLLHDISWLLSTAVHRKSLAILEMLVQACGSVDVELVMLDIVFNEETYNGPDSTLLHLACEFCRQWQLSSYKDIIQYLIDAPCGCLHENRCPTRLDRRDSDGWTVLMLATQNRNTELVDMLLNAGADPNVEDNLQETVVHYAIRSRSDELLLRLLRHGAHADGAHKHNTPLYSAIQNGDCLIAQILLEFGANVNFLGSRGERALVCAITEEEENLEIVELLLRAGADPNDIGSGDTTLCVAAKCLHHNSLKICRLLIDGGALLDYGHLTLRESPLNCNIEHGKIGDGIAQFLVAAGSPLNYVSAIDRICMGLAGEPPYHADNVYDLMNLLRLLIEAGYCADRGTVSGFYALIQQSEIIEVEQAEELLSMLKEPLSLKQLSRIAVRRHCIEHAQGKAIFKLVLQLPLPKIMKTYLVFDQQM